MSTTPPIKKGKTRQSLVLFLVILILTGGSSLAVVQYSMSLPCQKALIISANLLFILYFLYNLILYSKKAISAILLIITSCLFVITSFLIVKFACPNYYIHHSRCSCPDCEAVYYETYE